MPDHDYLDEPADGIPASMLELAKIPRRLWEQVLAPLPRSQRFWVASQIQDDRLRALARDLAGEIDIAECQLGDARLRAGHRALRTGSPLPTPVAEHAAIASKKVQVNIRLRRDDHTRLTQAADAVGLRPTTLARALVLNGAAQILNERGAT